MDWIVYNRAKNLESYMKIIKDTLDGKIAVDDKSPFWPLYCLLIRRDDFKEYMKNVFDEFQKEFSEL